MRNFPGFDFREVDRDLERAERRRFAVPFDRPFDEPEPFRLRRGRPPTRKLLDRCGGTSGYMPSHELTTLASVGARGRCALQR